MAMTDRALPDLACLNQATHHWHADVYCQRANGGVLGTSMYECHVE